MSDFAERIRKARTATELASRPHLVDLTRASAPAAVAERRPAPTLEELEAQRRRITDLTRRIDELNAAILDEIVQHPETLAGYPRTAGAPARSSSMGDRLQRG